MHGFFKCKDKKWDGGIQILWAKSVKWRQIRARWGISVGKRGICGRNRVVDLKKVCICTQILNHWLFFRCDRGNRA